MTPRPLAALAVGALVLVPAACAGPSSTGAGAAGAVRPGPQPRSGPEAVVDGAPLQLAPGTTTFAPDPRPLVELAAAIGSRLPSFLSADLDGSTLVLTCNGADPRGLWECELLQGALGDQVAANASAGVAPSELRGLRLLLRGPDGELLDRSGGGVAVRQQDFVVVDEAELRAAVARGAASLGAVVLGMELLRPLQQAVVVELTSPDVLGLVGRLQAEHESWLQLFGRDPDTLEGYFVAVRDARGKLVYAVFSSGRNASTGVLSTEDVRAVVPVGGAPPPETPIVGPCWHCRRGATPRAPRPPKPQRSHGRR